MRLEQRRRARPAPALHRAAGASRPPARLRGPGAQGGEPGPHRARSAARASPGPPTGSKRPARDGELSDLLGVVGCLVLRRASAARGTSPDQGIRRQEAAGCRGRRRTRGVGRALEGHDQVDQHVGLDPAPGAELGVARSRCPRPRPRRGSASGTRAGVWPRKRPFQILGTRSCGQVVADPVRRLGENLDRRRRGCRSPRRVRAGRSRAASRPGRCRPAASARRRRGCRAAGRRRRRRAGFRSTIPTQGR